MIPNWLDGISQGLKPANRHMADLVSALLVVLGFLGVLLLRYAGTALHTRFRKRRQHLNEARRHFVKAASLLSKVHKGKLSTSEIRSIAGTALQEADLALDLDPKDAAILIVKSLALEHLGKPAASVKVLDLALSRELQKSLSGEERADTLAKRAQLLLGLAKGNRDEKIKEALADLQESVALRPSSPRAQLMLGTCYERTGDNGAARAAFQQVLVSDPSSPGAKAALERLNSKGFPESSPVAAYV